LIGSLHKFQILPLMFAFFGQDFGEKEILQEKY